MAQGAYSQRCLLSDSQALAAEHRRTGRRGEPRPLNLCNHQDLGSRHSGQINAWHLFALASLLLGNDGHSYFAFTRANTQAGIVYDDPWEHANVGQPTGAYTRNADGSYQRLFTTGEAIVNPTSTSVTVTPAHAMCGLGGVSHNSVILGPESAQVLTDC